MAAIGRIFKYIEEQLAASTEDAVVVDGTGSSAENGGGRPGPDMQRDDDDGP